MWSNYALSIALHPFDYAKVLIQLGYEPIAPRPTTDFFGRPALKLPNIFEYVHHIRSIDGIVGCYRGLTPKICGNLLSAVVRQKIMDTMEPVEVENEEELQKMRLDTFLKTLKCHFISHTAAIIVSQPFSVISVRIMAQFVGRETKYNGLVDSISEIYHQHGPLGFFTGLVPRLIGDILFVVLGSTVTFALNSYLVKDKDMQIYTCAATSFLATAITHPFQVVSNCMIVSGSGLVAGSPLYMPYYSTWIDCWKDLQSRNQLRRGSRFLVRYYIGETNKGWAY